MPFSVVKNCTERTILPKESDYLCMPVWRATIFNMLPTSQQHGNPKAKSTSNLCFNTVTAWYKPEN